MLPRQQFRIAQHQSPYRRVVTVYWSLPGAPGGDELFQLFKTFFRAIKTDSPLFRLRLTVLAKAGTLSRRSAPHAAKSQAERVGERALPFRHVHYPVHIVRANEIFHHAGEQIAVVRIVLAGGLALLPVEIVFP